MSVREFKIVTKNCEYDVVIGYYWPNKKYGPKWSAFRDEDGIAHDNDLNQILEQIEEYEDEQFDETPRVAAQPKTE